MDTHETNFINCHSNSRYGTWRHVWIIWGKEHLSVQSLWNWLDSEIFHCVASTVNLTSLSLCTARTYLSPLPDRALERQKEFGIINVLFYQIWIHLFFSKWLISMNRAGWPKCELCSKYPFWVPQSSRMFYLPVYFPCLFVFFNFLPIEVHFWVRIPVKTRGIHTAQLRLSGGRCVG